jgi:hypothetical protein
MTGFAVVAPVSTGPHVEQVAQITVSPGRIGVSG